MADIKEELRQTAASMLNDPVLIMAFVEHQMDLMGQLILDLAENATLTPEQQERVDMLKQIMQYSSIDFANISNILQAYKVPKTAENKQHTRMVQDRYLKAQMRAGVFGS
jgi:hypothetical protein